MKKKTKMILISVVAYLLLSVFFYFLSGGFYFTVNYKKHGDEARLMSVGQLDTSAQNPMQGVCVGSVIYKGEEAVHFQFSGLFKEKKRLLDIYSIKNDSHVYFQETETKEEGKPAFFILRKRKSNPKAGEIFKNYFYKDKKLTNIATFLTEMGVTPVEVDSLFVLSLDYNGINELQELLITENSKSCKTEKRNLWFHGSEWKLRSTKENKEQIKSLKTKNFGLAILDIVTGGVQAIIYVFYFFYVIFEMITGKPVK